MVQVDRGFICRPSPRSIEHHQDLTYDLTR